MNEQKDFFSPNHNRLLSIAVWAKYLSWIVLIVYIIWAILQLFQYQVFLNHSVQPQLDIWLFLRLNPLEAFRPVVNMATTVLSGVVYFLVLKGISLGLNMIVETDINYRQRRQEEGAQ